MSDPSSLPGHRAYLRLVLPLTAATLSTPLLGMVDTAVVGNLGDPAVLGGTALAVVLFNTLYWLFGFLRVSTSGFAAQARGSSDMERASAQLIRPLAVSLLLGLAFILLQKPIFSGFIALYKPDPDVARFAWQYYGIRVWGAPVTLANYAILGWLLGMAHIRQTLILQIGANMLNLVLALLFVQTLSWGAAGAAWALLIAESGSLLLGLAFVLRSPHFRLSLPGAAAALGAGGWAEMFRANADLFIRTLCLLGMINGFTAASASLGTTFLAANAILLQIHYFMAYLYDGIGNAGSLYAGQAKGSGNAALLRRTIRLTWFWTAAAALLMTLLYQTFKEALIPLFASSPEVIRSALAYSGWLTLFPAAAGAGITFYGVFTGLTETGPIRNSMLLSLAAFAAGALLFLPAWGNDGLWAAFTVFAAARSVFLLLYLPGLQKRPAAEASRF